MTGKRKGIGLFGDCQSTNLRPVNPYFPQFARRTKKNPALAGGVNHAETGHDTGLAALPGGRKHPDSPAPRTTPHDSLTAHTPPCKRERHPHPGLCKIVAKPVIDRKSTSCINAGHSHRRTCKDSRSRHRYRDRAAPTRATHMSLWERGFSLFFEVSTSLTARARAGAARNSFARTVARYSVGVSSISRWNSRVK